MAGTTVCDQKEVETCFQKAAFQTGLNMTEDEITAVQGWSKLFVFQKFWAKQGEIEEIAQEIVQKNINHSYSIFKQILENHYNTSEIIPTVGCLELFSFLQERKIKIALTTGFYRKVADIILEKLGWLYPNCPFSKGNQHIDCSLAGDEVISGRPAPDMIYKCMEYLSISSCSEVINIGDTPSDLESGKRAGVRLSLGLTNGTHTRAQLENYPNDGLFGSLNEFQLYLAENI